jgi:hypothetical protein
MMGRLLRQEILNYVKGAVERDLDKSGAHPQGPMGLDVVSMVSASFLRSIPKVVEERRSTIFFETSPLMIVVISVARA